MIYKSEITKATKEAAESTLIRLWCKSTSYDEFVIKASSAGLYCGRYVWLFRLFWFKKEHSVIYHLVLQLVSFGLVWAMNIAVGLFFGGHAAAISIVLSTVALCLVSHVVTEFSWKIESAERGIPIA